MKIEYQEREKEEDFGFDEKRKPNSKGLQHLQNFGYHSQKTSASIPNPCIVYIEHVSGLWNEKLLTETRPFSLSKSLG